MEDLQILEAVERYIGGEMNPNERVYFEALRKSNPEIDQAVVEHTFFLQQIARFEDTRQFKNILDETHIHLAEKGLIQSPKLKGGAKVVYLFNRYKRTAAIAASVAGIMALSISAMVWSFSPGKNTTQDVQLLNSKINNLEVQNKKQDKEITTVINHIKRTDAPPDIKYTTGGTGFLVDAKGYLVTNAHVIEGATYVAVQNASGKDFKASIVWVDAKRDIAILKIIDTAFKTLSSIPYAIKKSGTDIAEPVFSLGFPRSDFDIVYGEGYLSAKTGYNGDTLAVQISIDANRGNSGSPIINRKGEVIAVLSSKQTSLDGAVFAIQSKYIYDALSQLQKSDTTFRNIRLPVTSSIKGIDRTRQVQKITDFVYMVKVN
jgi:serine protease Do